jgi:hypothetical protein
MDNEKEAYDSVYDHPSRTTQTETRAEDREALGVSKSL